MTSQIEASIKEIKSQIASAAERSGRAPEEISLLAATKTRGVREILGGINAGITLIGENTVQEALAKFEFLPPNVEKQMIGSLQLNKVRQAVRLFDLIQSVNSVELAEHLDSAAKEIDKVMPVLIEVNAASEKTKRGIDLESVEKLAEVIAQCPNLQLRGLMTMAPHLENPEELRPLFRMMKEQFEKLREPDPKAINVLSMGMSNDYVIAIEEGSTLVRLGTTIFGERDYT